MDSARGEAASCDSAPGSAQLATGPVRVATEIGTIAKWAETAQRLWQRFRVDSGVVVVPDGCADEYVNVDIGDFLSLEIGGTVRESATHDAQVHQRPAVHSPRGSSRSKPLRAAPPSPRRPWFARLFGSGRTNSLLERSAPVPGPIARKSGPRRCGHEAVARVASSGAPGTEMAALQLSPSTSTPTPAVSSGSNAQAPPSPRKRSNLTICRSCTLAAERSVRAVPAQHASGPSSGLKARIRDVSDRTVQMLTVLMIVTMLVKIRYMEERTWNDAMACLITRLWEADHQNRESPLGANGRQPGGSRQPWRRKGQFYTCAALSVVAAVAAAPVVFYCRNIFG